METCVGYCSSEKLTEMAKYFPAFSLLLGSLENYSLCEKHYNHIIARKYFIEQLTKQDDSSLLNTEEVEENLLMIVIYLKKVFPIWSSSIFAGSSA